MSPPKPLSNLLVTVIISLIAASYDIYLAQPVALGLFSAVFIALTLRRRFELPVSLLAGYLCFNYFFSYNAVDDPKLLAQLMMWGGLKMLTLISIAAMVLVVEVDALRLMRVLCLVNAVATLACQPVGGWPHGLIYSSSLSATFTIWLLPSFVGHRKLWPVVALALYSSTLQSGAGVYVVLAFYGGLALLRTRSVVALTAAALFAGFCLRFGHLTRSAFYESSRLMMYWDTLKYQWQQGRVLTGFGVGSFPAYGHKIQAQDQLWLSLHNDWQQILFELGVVGLALFVWWWVGVARRLPPIEQAMWLGAGVIGCFYFPAQVPFWLLLLALLSRQRRCQTEPSLSPGPSDPQSTQSPSCGS